jgi:hypothetical protein
LTGSFQEVLEDFFKNLFASSSSFQTPHLLFIAAEHRTKLHHSFEFDRAQISLLKAASTRERSPWFTREEALDLSQKPRNALRLLLKKLERKIV